nr:integrase, catalytic region, zinc finger, CCHC-type, peptidase aspartic, catalytic [Tanacetum cinerariifolium]
MGYGDYKIGNVTISRVYFVEGLRYNLFSVGQFCDSDLEVAFRQHTCFIRNLDGVDLLTGSRGNNLYISSVQDMMASSPIYLLSKASKTKNMAITIEQQTMLDESLVLSTQRLRIGRSNFRLPSDIQSKEATLQVVYDVLRNSPLFRAFQVTADVPDIYIKAYKEYHACAMGEAAPIPKASARKKKGDSASSTTPPTPTPTTTIESALRLSATTKGKQPSRATTPTKPTDIQRTKSEQFKFEEEELAKDYEEDKETGKGGDEVRESEGESDEEETR